MKKRMILTAFVALALGAGAADWFDAGISGYTEWPSDGSDFVVADVGTWSGTTNATLVCTNGESRLRVFTKDADDALSFSPAAAKDIAESPTFKVMTTFCVSCELEDIDPSMKTAITALDKGNGQIAYYGYVANDDRSANCWAELSGATPRDGVEVEVDVYIRTMSDGPVVRYVVDGTPLSRDNSEWMPIFLPDGSARISEVCYAGCGDLLELSAKTNETVSCTAVTIPEIAGADLVSVKVGETDIAVSNGTYVVESGAKVVVTFQPQAGKVLSTTTMSFRAAGDAMELPAEGRPVALVASEVLRVNEVMASNETALNTAGGVPELDWVEIRNTSDYDLDISGWAITDDPTKKFSKWKSISGPAVVPAHGYLIVWLDSSFDGWDLADVHAPLGLSAGGEAIGLATPDGTIVSQFAFDQQLDDVSFGYGHHAKTVLGRYTPAEYRVGAGEWTSVVGPVGMSGAAGGFQVVVYAMNNTVSTMDTAEQYLRDSTKWLPGYPVTNTCATIAFQDNSSQTNFAPYASFPGVSGDNFVVVITGTIMVPEPGLWSFSVGSDDGFSAKISRLESSWTWENRGARGYGQSTATFNLPEAGAYDVELVYFEKGGGAALDFSAAQDEHDFSLETFHLVGSSESGLIHAGALGASVAADVSEAMAGASASLEWRGEFTMDESPAAGDSFKLRIRYADGFTASLNGTQFASVPASGARSVHDALTPAYFDIPAELVCTGTNTLEVTGYNDSLADTEFFLSPEVVWDMSDEQLLYFPAATPGAENGDGRSGLTPQVSFSEPHGYKTGPFQLELSCPDNPSAAIFYTTDGTSPTPMSSRYTEPISVSSTTVVRAAVPETDAILQRDSSASYLFLSDILQQTEGVVPAGFPESGVNKQVMVYGLRGDIVNGDADTVARLNRGFTNSIQTISLVIDPADLFDGTKGIYVNAKGNGKGWERPTMVEQIDPVNGAAKEFSVSAGIRIRGAYSRGPAYPKHSLRLFFRGEYGMSKLDFPLFDGEGTDSYKKIDLRTAQNYSWANGNVDKFTFIEECFSRDSQRDMGEPYNRSRYYNLFINGVYWGVYQTEERVDRHYAESYNGDVDDNYDVVRTSQPGYNTGVVEGDGEAWHDFWDITVNEGYGDAYPDNYNRVRGLNPDGTRNPDYPVYLNETNVMVHMITVHYSVDSDAPASAGGRANNIATFRDRVDGQGLRDGFIWNRHDAEHSLGTRSGYGVTKTDFYKMGTREQAASLTNEANFNTAELHYELCSNAEYRVKFADQVYKHCLKPGGAMTAPVAEARFRSRMAELDDAVVCEAARWGRTNQTYSTWLQKGCAGRLSFIANRTPYLIQGYRNAGWYPSIDAPTTVNSIGQELTNGTVMTTADVVFLNGSGGTVYYTTDGSDPRLEGGAVSASATAFAGTAPVIATNTAAVIAKGDGWTYYDWGREPGADTSGNVWRAAGYNAASLVDDANSWLSGSAPLGFKSGTTFNTSLYRYVDHGSSGTQVMTFYFRKTFTVPDGVDASSISSVSGTAWYDDGFVMYINGVEVGRGNIGAGYTMTYETGSNETGTTHVDPADHDFTFAVPQGLIHSGENVIAVEVHQCHGTSSDAAWDLAMGVDTVTVGTGEGGLPVSVDGLAVKARTLSPSGEWSALEDVTLVADVPNDTALGVRVAVVYSSTLDGGGDGSEFIVLTNLLGRAVSLEGMRITSAKTGKTPSLDITLGAGREIPAGGSVKLTKAGDWPSAKITNGAVDMMVYDPDGNAIQTLHVDASWWNAACDETGAYFVALEFGDTVTAIEQWTSFMPSVQSLALRVAAVYSSTADGDGDGSEFIVFTNLLDRTVSLEGLRFTCAKTGSAPGVDITLGAGREIPANGTVTLTKADDWPSKKITNGAVDIMVYDSDGATIQTLYVDANWWPVREYVNDKGKVKYVCACDGTGAHFIALEFGETVTAEAQWKPSFLPPPTEAGENAIIAAISADDRVRTWLDSVATTAAGHVSITNFSGEAASVQAAYLVGLDTLADPQADLFIEHIAIGADGNVILDGDLKVLGERWRQKVNGTLRLYRYEELGSEPSAIDLNLDGGTFPLVGAEDAPGTYRFFKLVIE